MYQCDAHVVGLAKRIRRAVEAQPSQDPDTCPFWRITEHVHERLHPTTMPSELHFLAKSRIEAPAEEVFRWHAQPDALERLSPPWDPVEILERAPVPRCANFRPLPPMGTHTSNGSGRSRRLYSHRQHSLSIALRLGRQGRGWLVRSKKIGAPLRIPSPRDGSGDGRSLQVLNAVNGDSCRSIR